MTVPVSRFRLWLIAISCFNCLAPTAGADIVEPSGYRLDNYRAETPQTLDGANVIGAEELHRLMLREPAVVIDVLPQPPRPPELPATTYWRPPTRRDIPGSIWLANVGYGKLSAEMDQYFRDALNHLALGDKTRRLVFYCEERCWMSWNAAKRALGYGYRNVYWFPGGVQEWSAHGYPTMLNVVVPVK